MKGEDGTTAGKEPAVRREDIEWDSKPRQKERAYMTELHRLEAELARSQAHLRIKRRPRGSTEGDGHE